MLQDIQLSHEIINPSNSFTKYLKTKNNKSGDKITKYKVEALNLQGKLYKRTIEVPKSFKGDIRDYLKDKMHKKIESDPEVRHSPKEFWKGFYSIRYYQASGITKEWRSPNKWKR